MQPLFQALFSKKNKQQHIPKNISFVLLKQTKDVEGRIVCVEAIVEKVPVVLCNIYVPDNRDTLISSTN